MDIGIALTIISWRALASVLQMHIQCFLLLDLKFIQYRNGKWNDDRTRNTFFFVLSRTRVALLSASFAVIFSSFGVLSEVDYAIDGEDTNWKFCSVQGLPKLMMARARIHTKWRRKEGKNSCASSIGTVEF